MVVGDMCVGVYDGDELMVRVSPDAYDKALAVPRHHSIKPILVRKICRDLGIAGSGELMPKVPLTREHERHAGVLTSFDHIVILDCPAGLCDRFDARVHEHVRAVWEGKKRIRPRVAAFCTIAGALDRESTTCKTVDLAHAAADEHIVVNDAHGIGL